MTAYASRTAAARLVKLFEASGYVRRPDPARQSDYRTYKKGSEVRLVLSSTAELKRAREALRVLGFTPGRPFRKSSRIVLPLYGAAAVRFFVDQLGAGKARRAAGFSAKGTRVRRRSVRRT